MTKSELSPVIIIGAGRSGTKFLRDVLDASYEILTIPYDVGYVWRYGNEHIPHDELTPEMLDRKKIKFIRRKLPSLVKRTPRKPNARIFLEKSVPNTLRPAFVHAVYPEAKFIHLIRDGRSVTESALRLWKEPVDKAYLIKKLRYLPIQNYPYAIRYLTSRLINKVSPNRKVPIWGPRYKGIDKDIKNLPIEAICAKQWKKCIETSISQLSKIDKKKVLEVRYEKLMSDHNELKKICNFLNLEDDDVVVNQFYKKVNMSHLEKWRNGLDDSQLDVINNEIKLLNSTIGYNN